MSLVMNSNMLKCSLYICMCNVICVLHVCMWNLFLSDEKITLIGTVAKLQITMSEMSLSILKIAYFFYEIGYFTVVL